MPNKAVRKLCHEMKTLDEDYVLINVMRNGVPISKTSNFNANSPSTASFCVVVKEATTQVSTRVKDGNFLYIYSLSKACLAMVSLYGITSSLVNGISTFIRK